MIALSRPLRTVVRRRAGLALAAVLATPLATACGGAGVADSPERLASAWSGTPVSAGVRAPAPRCRATRPDGAALPNGARWCEWATIAPARGRVTGILYAPLVTRAATAMVRWERPVADAADATRTVDSLAQVLGRQGLAERPCRPRVGDAPSAPGASRLFGNDRLLVHAMRPNAPSAGTSAGVSAALPLVVTALDEPTALDAIPCRRR